MSIPLIQVDAFSDRLFGGNPAAVCLLTEAKEESWMQQLAQEMNLSETAFLVPRPDGYDLRWFTPTVEVALCGHATLASAHALWSEGHLDHSEVARFHTKSGWLSATRLSDGWIEMDFPARLAEPAEAPAGLLESLGVNPLFVGRNVDDFLVEVDSVETLSAVQPDFARLSEVKSRGVIVTTRDQKYDFRSRFFAPAAGVPEDPVTGSAHCCLATYWSDKLGRNELVGFQASQRGGVVRVKHQGDRVLLGGQAVTVFRAELQV